MKNLAYILVTLAALSYVMDRETDANLDVPVAPPVEEVVQPVTQPEDVSPIPSLSDTTVVTRKVCDPVTNTCRLVKEVVAKPKSVVTTKTEIVKSYPYVQRVRTYRCTPRGCTSTSSWRWKRR